MKALIISVIVLVTQSSWASVDGNGKPYNFSFSLGKETLQIKRAAATYEEAYRFAANECFSHFKDQGPLSEDRGLDIIDVCANPR